MVPSLPLLSCESSMSVKENPDRKRKKKESFQDRIVVSARESITPLKLQKDEDTRDWVV